MKREKHLGLRMDGEEHKKPVYIAEYQGRSRSRMVIQPIQECVREFEKEHGAIQ